MQTSSIKLTCGCGRSPTGRCMGWHSLPEETYMDKLMEWESKNIVKKSTIITGGGADMTRIEFKTFEQLENYYYGNIDRWHKNNQATKVIGTVILVHNMKAREANG